MPTRGGLDLEQRKPWLGHLLRRDALGDGRVRYRVYGSAVAALYGRDLQGRAVDALPPSARAAILADYERALVLGAPFFVERWRLARPDPYAPARPMRCGKLILPLCDDVADCTAPTKLLAAIYPHPARSEE